MIVFHSSNALSWHTYVQSFVVGAVHKIKLYSFLKLLAKAASQRSGIISYLLASIFF